MHTLFYCSVATHKISEAGILDILKVSRKKNERDNVTGILVYQKNNREFFQILEGETQVIFALLKTIEFDKRNTSQHLVYNSEIKERNFKGWSMAFSDLDSVTSDKLDGFSEYLDKGFTSELVQEKTANASEMIKMFQFYLNNGAPN